MTDLTFCKHGRPTNDRCEQCELLLRYRALEARYDALVRHVADRAGVQLPPLIVQAQQREHLAHCPAHPFIAQCICDDEVPR